MGILLTRSSEENIQTAEMLREIPLELYFAPMLSFEDLDISLDNTEQKHLIITSKHAAKLVSKNIKTPKECWVVGKESANILAKNNNIQITGIAQDIKQLNDIIDSVPLAEHESFFNGSIYLSGNIITQELPLSIKRKVIYNTIYSTNLTEDIIKAISNKHIKYITVYSKNSSHTLISLLKQHNILRYVNSSVLIAISKHVADVFDGLVDNRIYPEEPNSESMLQLLKRYEKNNS